VGGGDSSTDITDLTRIFTDGF